MSRFSRRPRCPRCNAIEGRPHRKLCELLDFMDEMERNATQFVNDRGEVMLHFDSRDYDEVVHRLKDAKGDG